MGKKNTKAVEVAPGVEIVDTKIALPTIDKMIVDGLKTKSAMIRYLDSEGFKRSEIANHLSIRYQHVRNVLIQPLKKVA